MADRPRPPVPPTIEARVGVGARPRRSGQAIATGPGISSWYVPTVEEHEGGAALASFGPGPEMTVPGRVAAGAAAAHRVRRRRGRRRARPWLRRGPRRWHPHRPPQDFGLRGALGRPVTTTWWVAGSCSCGTCSSTAPTSGAKATTAVLPMGAWPGTTASAWSALCQRPQAAEVTAAGDDVATAGDGVPASPAPSVDAGPTSYGLLLTEPAPGTAFLAAEGHGEGAGCRCGRTSPGPKGAAAAER